MNQRGHPLADHMHIPQLRHPLKQIQQGIKMKKLLAALFRYCRHEMWQNGAPVTNFMIACQKPSIATTFQTGTGNCSIRTYLGEPVFGAELRRTTANSSTQCSGFFAPARRGETCRSRMGGGKTPIDAFAVGATRVFGSRYWKSSLSSPITNGS